jgi:hypothetical protein
MDLRRWKRRAGNCEHRRRWRIPKTVRQLHDRTVVVVVISIVMMNRFVPLLVHRQGETRRALQDDRRRNERMANPGDHGAATHGSHEIYIAIDMQQ